MADWRPAFGMSGSSPRERGTLCRRPLGIPRIRFIPARAGNAWGGQGDDGRSPVHPRASGERPYSRVHSTAAAGSSPRERGTRPGRLGEKLAYIARHWDGLQVFLADGRVEMDSNAVENLARPIALNRKNALFAGHDEGAGAWARIASLIETAKLNRVEPYAWLKATLEAIAAGHPNSRIDDLLPFRPSSS